MKRIFKFILILLVPYLICWNLKAADPDIELLRQRIAMEMMAPRVDDSSVRILMESIKEDGTWPGINYVDVSRTGFQHSNHLLNLVELCRAYKKQESKFRGNTQLKKVIYSALDYWLANDFICDNWWWNQIGTPDQMIKVLFIMDKELTPLQIEKVLPIAGRANLSASGARPSGDRIKIAGILAKTLLFSRNAAEFDEVIKVIAGEVKFSTERGVQYDYSFHHRTDRVTSTLSYGVGYADAFAEWAVLVADTKYKFPESASRLLIDYYIDGICQTMVYGKYPDPGAENRSITRKGSLRQFSATTPGRLLLISSYRKDELERIVKIRKGEMKPDLTWARFYWDSEYFSYQRPGFFTSVRMYSARNNNMEVAYNGEGLMNHHYADGSNFISRTAKEYSDIFPVYDWQKIPGTTVVQKVSLPPEGEIQKKGLTDFVGAVTDGQYGSAAFDFKSVHDPLEAKKSWFFFDDEYACLGAGISSGVNLPVVTTLNQSLLKGDVSVMTGNEKLTIKRGEHELKDVKWIIHDSIAYVFPQPVAVNLSNKSETGSWYKINRQSDSPKGEINLIVFKLWLQHGNHPADASYQYIVIPSAGAGDTRKADDLEILSNTTALQAVRHKGLGICEAVFYTSGFIDVAPGIKLGSDGPALVMVRMKGGLIKSITVSDPTRKLSRINLTANVSLENKGNISRSVWDEVKGLTKISIELPQDVYAGKSVTAEFDQSAVKEIVIDEPGVRTLPANRDQARTEPWPEPSQLYLYKLTNLK